MTRKQFFIKVGLNQYRDKKPYLDLIKSYKGKLSYFRMYILIVTAVMFGKRGSEIPSYIEAVIGSK